MKKRRVDIDMLDIAKSFQVAISSSCREFFFYSFSSTTINFYHKKNLQINISKVETVARKIKFIFTKTKMAIVEKN